MKSKTALILPILSFTQIFWSHLREPKIVVFERGRPSSGPVGFGESLVPGAYGDSHRGVLFNRPA